MLIALEGCDGSGKSTLVEGIKTRLHELYPGDEVITMHASQLKTDVVDAYVKPLWDYDPVGNVHYILDRWHVGEQIYGPLYREKSAFTRFTWRWVEQFLVGKGMALCHVTNDYDTIVARLTERGEDFLQPEHVKTVIDQFDYWTRQSDTWVMSLTTSGDLSDRIDDLIDVADFTATTAYSTWY